MSECTSQDFYEDIEIIKPDDYEDIDSLFVSGSEDEILAEKEQPQEEENMASEELKLSGNFSIWITIFKHKNRL